ncbi:YdbH domain-containing protein [Novosphingobium profundi]|uniref:YdbH domain-containing protein n=1 Tax=Novosphingobium profundi TaxID=1774954 RepID=UPI001FE2CD72|nr:YdbH domain-containing protein [Novosphingobium profundi]
MALDSEQSESGAAWQGAAAQESSQAQRRRRRWRIGLAIGLVAAAGFGTAWIERKDIAHNLVERELTALGLPATYEIVRIGTDEQVVRNVVIGNPSRPDLTIEEIRIDTDLGFGWPGIGRVTLVRPRLYGRVHGGEVSFGFLDRVLFDRRDSSTPAGLPDLDVAIVDGRALVETDAGRVGVSLAGAGGLRGGFTGELGATARGLDYGGCRSGPASVYGKLSVSHGQPRLVGPVRLESLGCSDKDLSIAKAGLNLDLTLDETLDGGKADFGLASKALRMAQARFSALEGTGQATYRKGALNARYDLTARNPAIPALRLSSLELSGTARAKRQFSSLVLEADLSGRDVTPGVQVVAALGKGRDAAQGTFAASLVDKLRANLASQLKGSRFAARIVARHNGADAGAVRRGDGEGTDKGEGQSGTSIVVPQASVRTAGGVSLLEVSRVQAMLSAGLPRISGNFVTSGPGLPAMTGRMEMEGAGAAAFHVQMADYRQGADHLQVPDLVIRQDRKGDLTMVGEVRLGGALPGGSVENLAMPLAAHWGANGDLALWPSCTTMTFDSLKVANLALDRDRLSLCPATGSAIAHLDSKGFRLAAGTPSLALSGHLGESPIALKSGAVGIAYPGTLTARDVNVALGPQEAPSRFTIANLDALLTGDVSGTFEDADVALAAVPLDLHKAAGHWRFAKGVLALEDAGFELVDRAKTSRFHPLIARGASLTLSNNVIEADATLREPVSDRAVVRADIVHDLGTMRGHADLRVDDLKFGKALQPDQLADSVKGLVSSLKGDVHGTGRIDWNGDRITSRGRFASDGLDFAAPFGPVQGLSGEVVFTDLLGMVTAPDQRLKVASINPGIEVNDGVISFEMEPNYRLVVNGATWPFMQGTLKLQPTTMTVGAVETRRYTLTVTGLDAASLVRQMELGNVSASGVFDGELPIVFDEKGGRIEGGTLVARDPGGNVAYVGALTYEDLSAMGNFAFDALKSVDYKTMKVVLDGSLSGEIITRIQFSGVSQGAGAKRNFLTRQVAKLPIRFIVNIKAPFFQLFGNMRSLYDSNYVADPRALGLVGKDGKSPAKDGAVAPFISIQPPVSEDTP